MYLVAYYIIIVSVTLLIWFLYLQQVLLASVDKTTALSQTGTNYRVITPPGRFGTKSLWAHNPIAHSSQDTKSVSCKCTQPMPYRPTEQRTADKLT